ncbi:MAG: ATP-binding cassette domain-containing protein, partial [Lachnospiraceae bacterium]|nr:ATP-binding cassette domain-containing protein [Lachnospiraceae bacterium]
MILDCQHITKSFGTDAVLKQVSFHVEEYEKVAIVGINGAGKSTLLKIIMGELAPDVGLVTFAKDRTIGYLAQHQDFEGRRTIYEEVMEAKRDIVDMESQIRSMEEEMRAL